MYRAKTVQRLLRDQQRNYEAQLARKDEQVQQLLDRIQHPERTPIWREPPPPLEDFNPDVAMVYLTDASELEE